MAKQRVNTQADLFEEASPETAKALAPAQRTNVLTQLQALLSEASVILKSEPEAGDDQDQA
jgi:hypothetical protein